MCMCRVVCCACVLMCVVYGVCGVVCVLCVVCCLCVGIILAQKVGVFSPVLSFESGSKWSPMAQSRGLQQGNGSVTLSTNRVFMVDRSVTTPCLHRRVTRTHAPFNFQSTDLQRSFLFVRLLLSFLDALQERQADGLEPRVTCGR